MKLNPKIFSHAYSDGWLDKIEAASGGVMIEGWAFERKDQAFGIFPTILVASDWNEVARIETGNCLRQDVCSLFPELKFYENIGFSLFLPWKVVSKRGLAGIQLFVVRPDGKLSQLKKGFKVSLQVELTGRCNLRCPMCPSVIYSDFHKQELDNEDIKDLVEFVQDRDFICLDGFGESLLASEFNSLVGALPRATEVVFHTNGLLLDKKTEVILNNAPPISWMAVSLDSLDPRKYQRLRVGSSLEKVLENLKEFKRKRDLAGLVFPIIRLNLTLMKENYLELEQFIRLSLQFDSVVECNWLYDVKHFGDGINIEVGGELFDYDANKLKHIPSDANNAIKSASKLAERLGVNIIFNSYMDAELSTVSDKEGYSGSLKRKISDCPHLRGDYMLQADGKVQNCVWQTSPLFNWREHGIKNIKSHKRLAAIRSIAAQDIIPHECSGAGCTYVHLQLSTEKGSETQFLGGYSGKKESKKRNIKIKKI